MRDHDPSPRPVRAVRLTFGVARTLLAAVTLLMVPAAARASITVLVGEPFGRFGTMMPVGHAAVFLDHLCADGPLRLRQCRPGEPEGVVIARYHRIGGTDWVASPVMEFLYAAPRPELVPAYVTPELAWEMREQYRKRYLEALVPDGTEKEKATDEWWETAGVAYNRRLWGYRLDTTAEQDEHFMEVMNGRPNHHLYHLRKTNCANFAAEMVNLYFPGTVKRGDHVADFGLMTPKQVARCVQAYGEAHPELHFEVLEVPQLPGSLRRSRPVRGGVESGLMIKRYLFTLLVIQPEIPVGLAILYLDHGRWQVGKGAAVQSPDDFLRRSPASEVMQASTASSSGGETDPAVTSASFVRFRP